MLWPRHTLVTAATYGWFWVRGTCIVVIYVVNNQLKVIL